MPGAANDTERPLDIDLQHRPHIRLQTSGTQLLPSLKKFQPEARKTLASMLSRGGKQMRHIHEHTKRQKRLDAVCK